MRKWIAVVGAATLIVASAAVYAVAASGLKFKDYAVTATHVDRFKPLVLDTPELKRVRPYLEQAYRGPINFAGHYVLAVLGAGDGCETAAAMDVLTGRVQILQVAACQWRDHDQQPFYFKPDSRLLVLSGSVGMGGNVGAHYFTFDGQAFTAADKPGKKSLLAALFDKNDQPAAEPDNLEDLVGKQGMEILDGIEPAAGPQGGEELVARVQSEPALSSLWACFNDGLALSVGEVANKSETQPEYFVNLLTLGGFLSIGDRVYQACDKSLVKANAIQISAHDAEQMHYLFLAMLLQKDKALFDKCQTNTGHEWKFAAAFCAMRKVEFDRKLNSL